MNKRISQKQIRTMVDRAAELNAMISELKDEFDQIKGKLVGQGEGLYVGTGDLNISIFERTQYKFNSSIAKSVMTADQINQCLEETTSTVFRFVLK